MELADKDINRYLEFWPIARLATIGKDGSPHLIPLVFAYQNACFWSPVDGKPKRAGELTRIKNAISNPNGCLLLDHYDEDWSQLWWIRVDIRLEVVRLQDASAEQKDGANMALGVLRKKYAQYSAIPILDETNTLLAMHTIGIKSWQAASHKVGEDNRE